MNKLNLILIAVVSIVFIQPSTAITGNLAKHINNFNITLESTKDFEGLKNKLLTEKPDNIYIEEWLIYQDHTKDILKKLDKIADKINAKLYVVIGKNTWYGPRGAKVTLQAFKTYDKADGIVLRLEPNKTNIWQNYGTEFKVQLLNKMLDGYATIFKEASKLNKEFIAEFPYWLADFQGPLRTFPEDVCHFAHKISFLIDDIEMYDVLPENWNDVYCNYQINLTKRANNKTEDEINRLYKKFEKELSYDSYFKGYLIDSDLDLNKKETAINK